MTRVDVEADVIAWARDRSGLPVADLERRFPRLPSWVAGSTAPTLNQLEEFAEATHTPVGFFFLSEPPVEDVPLPDFRTRRSSGVTHPSPDLLDTIYLVQQRQEWYRNHVISLGQDPVSVVGSATIRTRVIDAAQQIREALRPASGEPYNPRDVGDAFRLISESAEEIGVLVMANGVVGSNTHRRLNPDEFRGFALADRYAPVVFVNGADTKSAQNFTLIHELAHIWLGETALSGIDPRSSADENASEKWCNAVAAEVLAPLRVVRDLFQRQAELQGEAQRLANIFKVSTLVILSRLHEAGLVDWTTYRAAYAQEEARLRALLAKPRESSGGNFYNTHVVRTSRNFARAVLISAAEGSTLQREAMQLLGLKTRETFDKLANHLGVS
ncbi:Zn-dependent peptidase ImmA, M78 family [Amycolatopsis lurida]|uniref:ImmA/IrrE family metallo-endopeptidase n=1 Tax=Amycolatopsis lurida TaxID=31959 RepID=UPI00089CA4C5|nr:ImmA/IrrE family metallo-endopeptidase [Amycolatopsis lurida]SED39660.1 Zn-dependent peptidase ImmA, M78 family [Amycolatopsis lurida]